MTAGDRAVNRSAPGFGIRDARPEEFAEVGALTADAYEASGDHTGPYDAAYDAVLRDAASRASAATLLVAVDDDGSIIGTATLAAPGSSAADIAIGDERELRMLGVHADARGRGVGRALVEESAFRAGLDGGEALTISVYSENAPAAAMYAKLGFHPVPERDWEPMPLVTLQVSRRELHCARCGELRAEGDHDSCDAALALEPPRYCPACKRRMTVQVRPTGWTATCSAHGTATR